MNSILMLVKIGIYKAAIGLVIYSQILMFYFCSISNYYVIVNILLTLLFVVLIFIILANDVESNPGPTSLLNFGHDDIVYDVDIVYEKWYRIFRRIVEKYIPFNTVTIRPKDKPWMCGQVRLAIRKHSRFLKLHNRNPTLTTWERYRPQ